MKKLFFYSTFISLFLIILLFSINSICFAWGDPEIVGKINSAIESIQKYILKISTQNNKYTDDFFTHCCDFQLLNCYGAAV